MAANATRRPPDGALVLEWVFGYNGHTARNNVKINAEGHLVYYVAGVGVVHDPKEQTQKFFAGHSDDITSLALNSERKIAATGQVGDDSYIAIWNAVTCAPMSVIHDAHSHQVVALAFSADSKSLASIGGAEKQMTLIVWDWQKGRRIARQVAHAGKVEEVEFDPQNSSSLVTCGAKHVKFWTLRGNVLQANLGIFGKAPQEDQISVTFLGKDKIVSGCESGHLLVWAGGKVSKVIENVHPVSNPLPWGGFSATEAFRGGVITGGRDGSIRIYDKNLHEIATVPDTVSLVYKTASPIQSLSSDGSKIIMGTQQNEIWVLEWGEEGPVSAEVVVQGHGVGEVWGLATHPSEPVALTGSDDGTIRLWSLVDFRQITSTLVGEEVRSVAFTPSGVHVAAGLLYGSFLILETVELKELKRVSDRKEARQDIRYSPDGKLLAVASNDNFVDIYNVEKGYEKIRELSGASSFITHLDWSTDSQYLQTNSGAGERLLYNIKGDGHGIIDQLPKGLEWATWTCVLGSDVKGLWAKYSDLSDVNAVDANFYYNIIVSGDDFGLVKLFRFPCPKKGSKPRASVGHSAHVTNVRWTADSSHVISLGGADHAIFVWKFRPSRNLTSAVDTVSSREIDEDSEEDIVETEDELEAIPEVTGDLEDEFTNLKSGAAGRSRRRRSLSTGRVKYDVEVREDSTFSKRCKTVDEYSDLDEPPLQHLRIEHVFGYRCYDSRDNCHWLKDGKIAYHVAAVGIVCDPLTNQQAHYQQHTDDILCLAVHPSGELVATGQIGNKPSIHVWSSLSLKILSFLGGGHERGVVAVAFSGDGDRIASIGMDDYHTVVVWKWLNGRKIASVRNSTKKVFGVRFSLTSNDNLLTFGVRHIRVWTVVGSGMSWRQVKMGQKHQADTVMCCAVIDDHGEDKWALGMASGQVLVISQAGIEKNIRAHRGAVYSIFASAEEGSSAWTGGRDGLVCEWDKKFQRCIKSFPISDHALVPGSTVMLLSTQSAIRSLSWHPTVQNHLLIGTQNSEILLMNPDGQLIVVTQGHCKGEVWGLAAHPFLLEAVTVSDDRTLRRWCIGNNFKPIGLTNLRKAARCVHFHPYGTDLAVGFLDGSVALLTYPDMDRIGGAHHRQEKIADVKFSPDGRMLAVASHDSFVDLYVVDTDGDVASKESTGLKRLGVCRDASSFISHVTWHKDCRLLQINSGAGEQLFYEAPKGTRLLIPEKSEEMLAWAMPLSCPLDVTLAGIWLPGNDLSDINAVATAHKLPLVATASDEGGLLKLFRYPCKGSLKRHRRYGGHSSHLTKVWWTFNDSYVITCGGADTAVIVWRVLTSDDEDADEYEDRDSVVAVPSDLPEEDVTVIDLEVSGLSEVSPLPPLIDSKRRRYVTTVSKEKRQNSEQLLVALQRLRTLPVIRDEKELSIFVLQENVVRYLEIEEGEVTECGIAHSAHDTQVTAIAFSSSSPTLVATASTGLEKIKSDSSESLHLDTYVPGDQGALINIWRPQDGALVTTLTTGDDTYIVTCLSFSPNGRFLAVLADASVIYVFNWIKGKLISDASLKTGGVVAINYSTDTTIAALTPKALFLCDMVGNALLPTRTLVPPGILVDPSVTFTSLAVDENSGHVFVGCSDASIVEWSLRIAIRRGCHTENKGAQGKGSPQSPSLSGVRSMIATGKGHTYLAFRHGNEVVVHTYRTVNLSFVSEHRTKTPSPTWRPSSISLGTSNLVLGGLKKEPVVLFNLKKPIFTTINTDIVKSKEAKEKVKEKKGKTK